jgi:hypothetical protein
MKVAGEALGCACKDKPKSMLRPYTELENKANADPQIIRMSSVRSGRWLEGGGMVGVGCMHCKLF